MEPTLIRPMLAQKYHPKRFIPGMFVQPKLNGIRALYQNGQFVSRDGIVWNENCLTHIREALKNVPPEIILDGELYKHEMSLQEINKRIAVNRTTPHKDEAVVGFAIFDVVSRAPFDKRYLSDAVEKVYPFGHAYKIPTYFAFTEEQATDLFYVYKKLKYEGLMYRCPTSGYSIPEECGNKQNRSFALLKRKSWEDMDIPISDFIEGEGKYRGTLGAFEFTLANGKRFTAGSGLTDMQRNLYWRHRDDLVGCVCKIQYEMLSDSGIPLKPIILLVNEPPSIS